MEPGQGLSLLGLAPGTGLEPLIAASGSWLTLLRLHTLIVKSLRNMASFAQTFAKMLRGNARYTNIKHTKDYSASYVWVTT